MDRLNEFFEYLKNEKRYSLNTISSYKRDFNDLCNYLKKENETSIDVFIVKNYLAYLYSKGLSKRTISRKIASLKSYFKFLQNKYNIKNNFIKNINRNTLHRAAGPSETGHAGWCKWTACGQSD